MIDVLERLVNNARAGEVSALCVVVHTRGSTPQDAGAAMLVLRDGATFGTLGGGCVEAEVRTRAMRLMSQPQTRLLQFRLDHDYGWDDGLVCGGTMQIAVTTVLSQNEAKFAEKILGDLEAGKTGELSIAAINEQEKPETFKLQIDPTPKLLIVGAGHVAQALSIIALTLNFEVTVVDDRADYAAAARFPGATCIVADVENELLRHPIDRRTYVVIVTRGHKNDARALAAVVNSPARYIGLIGSKRKIHKILDDLHQDGIAAERLAKVHAPIGLEISAVTPAEIAVSIAAELIAERRGQGDKPVVPMKIAPEKLERLFDRKNRRR